VFSCRVLESLLLMMTTRTKRKVATKVATVLLMTTKMKVALVLATTNQMVLAVAFKELWCARNLSRMSQHFVFH
jgi:hypothetical protein